MAQFKYRYHNSDGVRRTMIADRDDDTKFTVHTAVDMDEVVDGINRDRELIDPRSNNKLLARVPMTVYEKSLLEGWDDGDWKKWLNDSDNAHFRVWRGAV